MLRSETPLHRLVSRQAVESLLNAFAPLLGENAVSLFDGGGRLFAGVERRAWLDDPAAPDSLRVEDGLVYPLVVNEQLLGFLAARESSPAVDALRGSLAQLLEQGQEKRSLARETLERYREVNLIYHISETIGASLDAEEILAVLLREARRTIRADCGLVTLLDSAGTTVERVVGSGDEAVVEAACGVLQDLLRSGSRIEAPNVLTDLPGTPAGIGAILYAPLTAGEQTVGLLSLARQAGQPEFNAGDQKLLFALSSQAGNAIEKARLHQRELQQQRVEQELRIGERIQRSLLPRSMPVIPGWEFAAAYQSAGQIGGDFYDVFNLTEPSDPDGVSALGLAIADVTGKGIPAALMMAFSRAILRAAAAASPSPSEVLDQTNRLILQNSRSGLLLTDFYATLDPATGVLRYSNGGHEPPYLYQSAEGRSVELDCGRSALLGVNPSSGFEEREVTLAPGNLLVLYTDGISEARNAAGDFFPEQHLREVIETCGSHNGAEAALQAILRSVQDFTGPTPQFDDITLLVVKRWD